LIRYRTGDLVRLSAAADPHGRILKWMDGGILGRVDDMLIVRGNNVYPSSIEAVLREIPGIAEYRVEVRTAREMKDLTIVVEPAADSEASVEAVEGQVRVALQQRLGFAVEVRMVSAGALPRFEMKSRRVVDVDV
jgi:phenylacetate-CoA ligase